MITAGDQIETLNIKGDSLPWVPFAPYSDEVFLKYFQIDPVHGEILVSMRFPAGITLPTHYHTGIVIGHTMKGAWRYIEHDWVSEAGDTVYETAASAHTPDSCGDEEAEVFFVIVGELLFLDGDGNIIARENWKTSMERYQAYCETNGLEPRDLTSFSTAEATSRREAKECDRVNATARPAAEPGGVLGRRSGRDRALVSRGAGVLAGRWLAADDARSAGVSGAGPSSRRLDVLVDGGPQRVVPARDVPVRAAAGAADGARFQAVRHRVHADRRLGGRLRPDADATGARGLSAAQRPDGPRRGASRVRAQSRRRVRRDHGGRPALGRWTRPEQIVMPRRGALGHALGPRPRPVRGLLLPRTRPGALRCRAASARARGAVGSGRRADAQQRVQRRQRPRRARAVSRSGRAAAPSRLPDLRSRHPQRRLRRSEQA